MAGIPPREASDRLIIFQVSHDQFIVIFCHNIHLIDTF